jgi:hypothetical protein
VGCRRSWAGTPSLNHRALGLCEDVHIECRPALRACLLFFFFFFFKRYWKTKPRASDVRQVLYHLSHALRLLCVFYF